MRMQKRFRWKLLTAGAVLLFLVVWGLGPRERRERVLDVVNPYPYPRPTSPSEFDYDVTPQQQRPPPVDGTKPKYPDANPDPNTDTKQNQDPNPLDTTPSGSSTSPSSSLTFKTDPDLNKTIYCTSPYAPTSPLVQWALMIDAGSTGSRIHIYKFHNCHPSPEYEYEVFKMVRPGLSGWAEAGDEEGADAAAKSLDELMDEAVEVVPQEMRGCTPVAVKATAGLRLLGKEQSGVILEKVRERLEVKYPFPVVKKDGVVIMEGKDEGVYAWITANYLLNTIRSTTPPNTPSYAVLDLGGASTQIVFNPNFTELGATSSSDDDDGPKTSTDELSSKVSMEDGEHKYRLEFSGREHVLYQHSYLGYGLMHARKSVHRLVDFMHSMHVPAESDPEGKVGSTEEDEVVNPCLARGTRREVEIENVSRAGDEMGTAKKRKVTMVGADVGSFEACNRVVELVMAKNAICHVKPCSFNGVYQPSLLNTFPSGKVLLLSYFYDRLAPLLPSSTRTLPISTFATFAERVCLGPTSWSMHWGTDPAAMAELEDRPEHCLDLTFMHALLRLGYEFEPDRQVLIAKKVDDTELGWCLGATIMMLNGSIECTA